MSLQIADRQWADTFFTPEIKILLHFLDRDKNLQIFYFPYVILFQPLIFQIFINFYIFVDFGSHLLNSFSIPVTAIFKPYPVPLFNLSLVVLCYLLFAVALVAYFLLLLMLCKVSNWEAARIDKRISPNNHFLDSRFVIIWFNVFLVYVKRGHLFKNVFLFTQISTYQS